MRIGFSTLYTVALLLMSVAASPSWAAELLSAAPGSGTSAALMPDKTIKRQRLVNVNASGLAEAIAAPEFDAASDRVERSRLRGGKVTMSLFKDAAVDLRRTDVEAGIDGGVIWEGTSPSGDLAILVVRNGLVTGHIEHMGRSFLIDPMGTGNLHRVREIDTEAYPRDKHVKVPANKRKSERWLAPSPAKAGTPTEVTLLAVYTLKAKSNLGVNFSDKISLDVARTNKALENSGANLRVKLVGFGAVSASYNELSASNSGAPLTAITTGKTFNFPALRQLRTSNAADLVTMYTMRNEYCGLAWVLDGGFGDADFAFSVLNARCQGSLSLAHELGHNMGLQHDRYVENTASNSVYNYGYVNIAGRFRTVMSYSDECSDRGVTCKEITYYSTPRRSFNGRPAGIASGLNGAADSVRALNENRSWISGFR